MAPDFNTLGKSTIFSARIRLFVYFIFCIFRAVPKAYGDSQARGLIGAVAASLRQSHSNAGSEPNLQPTPQPMAMPDP